MRLIVCLESSTHSGTRLYESASWKDVRGDIYSQIELSWCIHGGYVEDYFFRYISTSAPCTNIIVEAWKLLKLLAPVGYSSPGLVVCKLDCFRSPFRRQTCDTQRVSTSFVPFQPWHTERHLGTHILQSGSFIKWKQCFHNALERIKSQADILRLLRAMILRGWSGDGIVGQQTWQNTSSWRESSK